MAKLVFWMLGLLIICSFTLCFIMTFQLKLPPVSNYLKFFMATESNSELSFPPLFGFNFTFKSMKEIWLEIYNYLPNFPTSYGDEKKFAATDCSHYPELWDIDFNNILWQRYPTSKGTFYLYGAYLDIRKANKHGPAIRIIGMLDHLDPKMQTFCLIWTNESQTPIITLIKDYTFLWRTKWMNNNPKVFQPYMITCLLPDEINATVPLSVSLVENKCDVPTNNLRIILNLPKPGQNKSQFAVCVKAINYPTSDASLRIMEWLEILSALGASKVFLYHMGVHPNLRKVLDHYISIGFLNIKKTNLPGFLPIHPVMQYLYLKQVNLMQMLLESMQYHDCIYRNMYLYEYIALFDTDEILIPRTFDNWYQLLQQITLETNRSWTTLFFENFFFLDEMPEYHKKHNPEEVRKILTDIPPYMHAMTHLYRSLYKTPTWLRNKGLHRVEEILTIENHFPIICLGPKGCESFHVNETFGRLYHYRGNCQGVLPNECNITLETSVLDTSIWKYKDRVLNNSLRILKEIGFY